MVDFLMGEDKCLFAVLRLYMILFVMPVEA
jgi:hypothetical protein